MATQTYEMDELMEMAQPGWKAAREESLKQSMVDMLMAVVAPEVQITKILKPQAIGQLMLKGIKKTTFPSTAPIREIVSRREVMKNAARELLQLPQEEFSRLKELRWGEELAAGTHGRFHPAQIYPGKETLIELNPRTAGKGTTWHEFAHLRHYEPGGENYLIGGQALSEAKIGGKVFEFDSKLMQALQDAYQDTGIGVTQLHYNMSPIEEVARATEGALGKTSFKQGFLKGLIRAIKKGAGTLEQYHLSTTGNMHEAQKFRTILENIEKGAWQAK